MAVGGDYEAGATRKNRNDFADAYTVADFPASQSGAGTGIVLPFTFAVDVHMVFVFAQGGVVRATGGGVNPPAPDDTKGVYCDASVITPIPITIQAGHPLRVWAKQLTTVHVWAMGYAAAQEGV